jgi:hypothetical protein
VITYIYQKIDISEMKLHSLSHILIIKPRISVVGKKKLKIHILCFSEWLQNGPHPLEETFEIRIHPSPVWDQREMLNTTTWELHTNYLLIKSLRLQETKLFDHVHPKIEQEHDENIP